jgi:hypothetical protein
VTRVLEAARVDGYRAMRSTPWSNTNAVPSGARSVSRFLATVPEAFTIPERLCGPDVMYRKIVQFG